MVICKFFLQGSCKYGDNCRFEHHAPPTYTSFSDSTSNSLLHQSNFGITQTQQQQQSSKNQNADTNTLVKSVVNDIISAEKGGQWLLSCYAPFKEKPAFPGFSDQSFEELRVGYYEAVKNGTVEQYKLQLQPMLQDVMMRVKALQNPSPDVVNVLKNIFNTPISTSKANVFGNNDNISTSNNFGQQSSIFGGQQPITGTSIFAKANQSLFGGTPAPASNNVFGNNNSNSSNIFAAAAAQNKNIFANQAQPINQNSVFGGQTNTNPFSQSTIFGNQPTQQMFVHSQNNVGQSVFQQHKTNSIFGAGQTQNSSESMETAQQSQQSIFGVQPQTSQSIFNVQKSTPAQPVFGVQPQPNLFGAPSLEPVVPQQNIFTNQVQLQANISNPPSNQIVQNPAGQQNSLTHQHTASIFGTSQVPQCMTTFNNTPQQPQTSIFGQATNQQNTNIFGGNTLQNTVIDESLYSKLEELTDLEKKWFEEDELDIRNIPEKPPTHEMCFRG